MECLTVNIYRHHSRAFVYTVWNSNHFIGEVVEDSIMRMLDSGQLTQLYDGNHSRFRIPIKHLKAAIRKPNYNY